MHLTKKPLGVGRSHHWSKYWYRTWNCKKARLIASNDRSSLQKRRENPSNPRRAAKDLRKRQSCVSANRSFGFSKCLKVRSRVQAAIQPIEYSHQQCWSSLKRESSDKTGVWDDNCIQPYRTLRYDEGFARRPKQDPSVKSYCY